MKTLFSFVAAFVLFTVVAQAQGTSLTALPGDPGATLVSRITFPTQVFAKEKNTTIQAEIFVWRTSANTTALTLTTPSILPMDGMIDYVATQEIFRQISTNAVRETALRGFYGTGSQATKVWYESNVERNGSGVQTRFAACATNTPVARDYTVSFNNGNPIVTDLSTMTYPFACGSSSGVIQ
jgi:hypothetical protein